MDVTEKVLSTLDCHIRDVNLKFNAFKTHLQDQNSVTEFGKLTSAVGTVLRSTIQNVKIGDLCLLIDEINHINLHAEVVALDKNEVVLVPLGGLQNLSKKVIVKKTQDQFQIENKMMLSILNYVLNKHFSSYSQFIDIK